MIQNIPLHSIFLLAFIIIFALILDLKLHKDTENTSIKSSLLWSLFWIFLAIIWFIYLRIEFGSEASELYLTGYLLEKSLSVDNLMVFIAIFNSFGVAAKFQHRVLYFGVLGAFVMRLLFVYVGAKLFHLTPWVGLFFALIILVTAVKMFNSLNNHKEVDQSFSEHVFIKYLKKMMPLYPKIDSEKFILKRKDLTTEQLSKVDSHFINKSYLFTPLFLCLISIEFTDVIFAFDSVPAVIAVTKDSFLVYSAMVFAILGLRALYFLLNSARKILVYLDHSVVLLLMYVAIKLLFEFIENAFDLRLIKITNEMNLVVVLGVLSISIVASIVRNQFIKKV